MYKQLQDKGEFKFLNITGHQIREGALSIIPRETKDAVKKKISDTSKLLAEGDLALKDLSEVHNPGSTLAIEQRREKASEAVSAVTTPLSNASKWFSDKTNTAPWVSDEVGAALITGGTSLIARRFMQAVKLANTARRISSTADKVTTTANQARQLGKYSNNAITRAKRGGAVAQRVRERGNVDLSNVADVLSLPKTGTQRPPLTSAAIVEKFKDKGFVPSGTLPLARQVAQVIKMDTQLARVSKLKNPNTRYEALALPTWSQSTYLKSFNRLPSQLQKRILDLRARSGERVHLHHWNSKMVDAKRKERMIALVNEGKASRDDIRLLDFALESRGEPGGGIWRPDGTKTIGALPEGFHQGVHARYQAAGLEKKWNWGSAVEKELGAIDNPTDLIEHAIQQRESMVPINLRVKDEAQRLWGLRF
jgi:hypothetical protein